VTKYRKGPQRSITGDHRGSAIMRKPPDLQQFCVKLHFFAAFCYTRYLQQSCAFVNRQSFCFFSYFKKNEILIFFVIILAIYFFTYFVCCCCYFIIFSSSVQCHTQEHIQTFLFVLHYCAVGPWSMMTTQFLSSNGTLP